MQILKYLTGKEILFLLITEAGHIEFSRVVSPLI